jgi:hypothetical protein
MADPLHASALFATGKPYARKPARREIPADFAVPNPLVALEELRICPPMTSCKAIGCRCGRLHPCSSAWARLHFVDARDPEAELAAWARQNARSPEKAAPAVKLLYRALPGLPGVKEGKYAFDTLIHRLIDEIIHAGVAVESRGGTELLKSILEECREPHAYLGAKRRPIGGLLPPGTSTAWKTPYGNEVPPTGGWTSASAPNADQCDPLPRRQWRRNLGHQDDSAGSTGHDRAWCAGWAHICSSSTAPTPGSSRLKTCPAGSRSASR